MENIVECIIENMMSDNMFVIDDKEKYSYRDLHRVFLKFNLLFEKHRATRVMICLPQGFFAYAAIISAFLSGITFCSVQVGDPKNRLKYFLEQYQPDMIITSKASRCDFWDDDLEILYVESLNVSEKVKEEMLYYANQTTAYVMFTSGSTGKPKGVKINREALLHICRWMKEKFQLTQKDICSQYSNLNYDMSLIDIFLASMSGAALVPFVKNEEKIFPGYKIKRHGITFWHSVPNVIDMLYMKGQLKEEYLGSIRKCKFGGEAIYYKQMERFFDAVPNAKVVLTYGLTEITFICCFLECQREDFSKYTKINKNMSIGKPIEGWKITLVNKENEIGEIVISGNYIGDGYIDEERSKGKFGEIEIDGKREKAFFTGDKGIYIDDMLFFVGRSDTQIKINGNRVDLSEINSVLRDKTDCVESYTFSYNNKIISTYIKNLQNKEEILHVLKCDLPRTYMPHFLFEIDSYPKNNSGKIDKQRLIEKLIADNLLRKEEYDYEC